MAIMLQKCVVFFALLAVSSGMEGGFNVVIGQFPHQLAMEREGVLWCGAAIITDTIAITAGQCVYQIPASELVLRSGSGAKGQAGSLHGVSNVLLHDKYNPHYINDYDVALVTVVPGFAFGPTTQPISVASKGLDLPAGLAVTASGWGGSSLSSLSGTLQAVTMAVTDWGRCNHIYSGFDGVTQRTLCAGADHQGPYKEDKGGPLVYGGVLVGVVCYGVAEGFPALFTDLTNEEIRDWITVVAGI